MLRDEAVHLLFDTAAQQLRKRTGKDIRLVKSVVLTGWLAWAQRTEAGGHVEDAPEGLATSMMGQAEHILLNFHQHTHYSAVIVTNPGTTTHIYGTVIWKRCSCARDGGY